MFRCRRSIILVTASACFVLLAGTCGAFSPTLYVVVQNDCAAYIEDVAVQFAGREITMGVIASKGHKSWGPYEVKPPSNVNVRWKAADGRDHSKDVPIDSATQSKGSGDIVLKVNENNTVRVLFKPRKN